MALPIAPIRKLKIKITPELLVLIEVVIVLLILTLGLFLYFQILKAKSENLRKEVEALQAQRNLELEKEIRWKIDFFERMKPVLKIHTAPSRVFDFLEKTILQNVIVNSLTFEPVIVEEVKKKEGEKEKLIYKLTLDLSVVSPETLIEQFHVFEHFLEGKDKRQKFGRINIAGVSIGQGEYKAIFEIEIEPEVLKYFEPQTYEEWKEKFEEK